MALVELLLGGVHRPRSTAAGGERSQQEEREREESFHGWVGLAGATLCSVYWITFSNGVRASNLKLS